MSNNKVYILQKDFPGHKSGTKFLKDPDYDNRYYPEWCFHQKNGKYIWENRIVYGITEADVLDVNWFLPEEDHEVAKAKELLASKGYAYYKLPDAETTHIERYIIDKTIYAFYFEDGSGPINYPGSEVKKLLQPNILVKYTEEDMKRARSSSPYQYSEADLYQMYHHGPRPYSEILKEINESRNGR